VLLPAVLELLGDLTWKLPRWLDERLPHMNIEGSSARADGDSALVEPLEPPELERDEEHVSA
jgi:RND superfamily putative drug exporter